jgi:hypothetical protein
VPPALRCYLIILHAPCCRVHDRPWPPRLRLNRSRVRRFSWPLQVDTNRLDVRSLVGLFYMLLLAMALAMAIAGIERFLAAHSKLWQRLRRPFTPVAVAGM